MGRVLLVVALAVPIVFSMTLESSSAAPLCSGKPATYVMTPGEGQYLGTAGVQDVIVGTNGADHILPYYTAQANEQELVCGLGGNDRVFVAGTGSKGDGGPGNDRVVGGSGANVAGGTGNDHVQVDSKTSGDGGSGDDVLLGHGTSTVRGGSGNDSITAYDGTVTVDCGSGSDRFHAYDEVPPSVRNCERTF